MRPKSRVLWIGLVLILMMALLPQASFAAKARRWKLATLAPRELGWAQQVRELVFPWIEEATDNGLSFKVYWGGVMGNDEDYLKKIHIGQLQGAGVSAAGANQACPEFTVLGLPFLFKGNEEVDYIRDTMFDTFDGYFQKNGFKVVLWIDQDFDQCYSSKHRMDTLEDFKRSRFQNWDGPMEAAVLEALGASPVPVSVMEGHSALKTGVLDAAFGPALYYVGSQLYTVFRYVNPMKIRYSPAAIVVGVREWNSLPKGYQDRIEAGREEVTKKFLKGIRSDNERCLTALIQYGLVEVHLTPENLALFKERTHVVYDQMVGELYPRSLLNEVQDKLADFRKPKVRLAKAAPEKTPEPPAAVVPEPEAVAPAPEPRPEPVAMEEVTAVSVEEEAEEIPAEPEMETPPAEPAVVAVETVEEKEPVKVEPPPPPEPVKEATAAAPAPILSQRTIIRKVQEKLKPLGYYPSTVDGLFGPMTYKGVLGYQQDHGLAPTGAIDQSLLDSLGIKPDGR